ncbi:MAG TPA: hypothetical protein VNL13_05950 [Sulfolobales archaeon]|nr:hypothetical protein [Sulfolobales archaeon]
MERKGIIVGIAGVVVFFELDLKASVMRERILPSIIGSDEPDRGDIEPNTEINGRYPKLVKKDYTIRATIKNIDPVTKRK